MEEDQDPLITINFKETFPGIYWISKWSTDESYPDGYRYKLLSNVNRETGLAELVVVIEETGGLKTEMSRLEVEVSALERVGQVFVDGLEDDFGLDFEMQDYTHINTADEYEAEIYKNGWHAYDA